LATSTFDKDITIDHDAAERLVEILAQPAPPRPDLGEGFWDDNEKKRSVISMATSEQQRIDYKYFQQILPDLLLDPLKVDKFAVIHNETIKGIYDTFAAAYRAACTLFDQDFIVQKIIDESKIVNYLSPAVSI